ncbi:MAG: intradiol ring-cleavage dioxygenase, partial [Verrucomicrobiota bacterium]
SGDKQEKKRDSHFQSYGRFLTDVKGRYYFRTIKPVPYGVGKVNRTPHIHFGISMGGKRIFTSQLMIQGDPNNKSDGLLNRIKDPKARATVLTEFKPIPDSPTGELSAEFDIILGHTIEEMDDGTIRGLGRKQG